MSTGEQLDHIGKMLGNIVGILAAITAVLGALLALFGRLGEVRERILKPTWNKLRKPLLILLILLATVVMPNGFMVWLVMYVTAQNTDRVREPTVFLSLTLELTAALSLYTIFWGLWLYPKLRPWLRPQMRNVTELSADEQSIDQEQVFQPPPEDKGGAS